MKLIKPINRYFVMKNKENIFELDKFAPYLQHVKRKNKTKMIPFFFICSHLSIPYI